MAAGCAAKAPRWSWATPSKPYPPPPFAEHARLLKAALFDPHLKKISRLTHAYRGSPQSGGQKKRRFAPYLSRSTLRAFWLLTRRATAHTNVGVQHARIAWGASGTAGLLSRAAYRREKPGREKKRSPAPLPQYRTGLAVCRFRPSQKRAIPRGPKGFAW
jgi:hypothetical protein